MIRAATITCAALASFPIFAQDISYPQFSGEIKLTSPNTQEFTQFLNDNLEKVVFLNLYFATDFGMQISYEVEEHCNAHFDFWEEGMNGQKIHLPYLKDAPNNPTRPFEVADIECEDIPFKFVDADLNMSSGGPGAHWFDIEGFFLIREQSDRWPFVEIKHLPASAETWARIKNK